MTDIAKSKNQIDANEIIRNWLRNRNTIEFLGTWGKIYNQNFNIVEFNGFKKEAGLNSFTKLPLNFSTTIPTNLFPKVPTLSKPPF